MTVELNLLLDYLFHPASAPASAPGGQPWLLVLMHGVGSNAQDLFGLAPYVPQHCHVLSLQGPFPMGQEAHAWFQFSVLPDGSRHIDEAQEAHSRAVLERTLALAGEQLGVPPERTVVGGFSQGGIMALSLLLTQPALQRAALVWHSRLLPEVLPLQAAPAALQGKDLWVSHGTVDNVIPLAQAHAIRAHVQALPLALRYREYPCVHTIHPQELRDSMDWLHGLAAG